MTGNSLISPIRCRVAAIANSFGCGSVGVPLFLFETRLGFFRKQGLFFF
jgi:hypothetical protein